MLETQVVAGLTLSGLMLVTHFGNRLGSGWIKSVLTIICACTLSYIFNPDIMYSLVSLTLIILTQYNNKRGADSLLNASILVAAFACANWVEPGLVEMIAALTLVGKFIINGRSNMAKVLPLFAALITSVALSSVYQNKNSDILLMACGLFVVFYYGLFWYQDKNASPYANASLFILTIFFKFFIDQHLLGLTAKHALIVNNLIVGALIATSIYTIYLGRQKEQNGTTVLRLALLNVGFTTAGIYIDSSFGLSEITGLLAMLIGIAMLLKIEQAPKKHDQYIAGVLGLVIILLQFLYIKTHLIGVPAVYILILNLSAQLFFLIKIIGHCEKTGQVTVKTGERLPQFVYIVGVFGAIASLWYILIYVRQIQG
ncbi:MAG: hypothetical protein CME71_04305 [Halobacteriovorax sp.]|nr:hypothetical protein [Halobacteriovorax sp.]